MSVLAKELRGWSDDDLARLLDARPDLASPGPSSVVALATRAATRPSVERALAGLNRTELDVAEALVVLSDAPPAPRPISVRAISDAVGGDAAPAVTRLRELALVTGEPDLLLPLVAVVEALGPYPAGLGPSLASLNLADRAPTGPPADAKVPAARRPAGAPAALGAAPARAAVSRPAPTPPTTPEALAEVLAEAPEGARRILDALRWGPPLGTVDAKAPGPGAAWLLDHGLLRRVSATQVVLPRDVALAARGGRTHRTTDRTPPVPEAETRAPEVVAAESARAAEDSVRRVAALLDLWDETPPTTLRTGGVGARELRRVGSAIDLSVEEAAFVIELAAAAGLVGPWSGDEEPTWLPTVEAERWLAGDTATRWAALARAWIASPRAPWLVGTRSDKGELRAALAKGLERTWVPGLRRGTLAALASWPTGSAPTEQQLHNYLLWQAPRSTPPTSTTGAVLKEVAWLGLTGAGALGHIGRALLTGSTPARGLDPLVATLEADLPPIVDEIVIQGDLTGLVPGRPAPELAELLDASADAESRGGALTVRFTAGSVRRALDRGMDSDRLLASMRRHSRTPLPQPLEYLVADVARKHASLRIGVASSYLRSEDTGALAALVADARLGPLRLRAIAPTVLVSAEPVGRVLEVLRSCQVGAVVEGPDGLVVSVEATRRRAVGVHGAASGTGRTVGEHAAPDPTELVALVTQMRAGDAWAQAAAAAGGAASSPAHALEVLRDAASSGTEVRIELAGATGALDRRRVRPLSVEGGRLRALDLDRECEMTIAVHRIASVAAVAPAP